MSMNLSSQGGRYVELEGCICVSHQGHRVQDAQLRRPGFCRYQVAREIRMHSELHNENIISLYCAWKDAQFIHVAVEWAPNGDIFSMLKRFGDSGVAESIVVTKVRPCLHCMR